MSEAKPYDLKNIITDKKLVGLWRMLTGYKLLYISAILFVGFAAVARAGFYFLLAYFTDDVLGAENMLTLLPLVALGFVLLAAVQGFFSFLSGRNAAQTAESVTRRLRNYLYDHLQRLTYSYHDRMNTGELVQRSTSDVDALRRFYSEQAIGIGRISLLFLVNFVGILVLNVQLGLISVILIPFIILLSVFFFKRVSVAYEAFQEQDGILSTTLQENLSGVRVVKAFARQKYERNKFEGDNSEKFRRGQRLIMMHSLFWPVSDIMCGFQMLLGFTVGAIMAINGTITVGEYLAYAGLVIWIIWPIRNLGRLVVQMSTGLVSFGRVLTVLREGREPLHDGTFQPDGDVRGEIVFDKVDFAYGEAPVLHEISFRCAAGQTVALLGSTGSGKTSLVNLLPRFYEYTGGNIRLDGVELNQYSRGYLRHQIGIVAQEPFLFSRTLRENIAYGVPRPVSDEEVEAAARAAAIHDVILTFPDGYNTLVGERGVTLSGGQKQRVTIARTLLKDAPILVLDDAVSAVDTETEAAIQSALHRDGPGRTTFIIAHRIQSVMHADIILVMDQGRIVQQGTHEQLLDQPGPYRRIFDLQARIEDELADDLAHVNGNRRNGQPDGHGNGHDIDRHNSHRQAEEIAGHSENQTGDS
jgi:ATP-binding cassette subfamily B protein